MSCEGLLTLKCEERYVDKLKETEAPTTMDSSQLDDQIRPAVERLDAQVRARMAAPGALGLPPLLEHRRLTLPIPDSAFARTAFAERVLVWQVAMDSSDRIGGGLLFKPATMKDRERHTAPRGVVLSAGLAALDQLRSNGIDIGHLVNFAGLSPYEIHCDTIGGHQVRVTILHAGDIFASEDTGRLVQWGFLRREKKQLEDGTIAHCFQETDHCFCPVPTVPRHGYEE